MHKYPQETYIAFGANEGDPAATLSSAIPLLEHELGRLISASHLYETRALTLDGEPQKNYINAALRFSSSLTPLEILDLLMRIELHLGRRRDSLPRWAPREIDLDLLFVGALTEQRQRLILPHPEIANRDFVLTPLEEIAPNLVHPVLGKTIKQLEQSLEERGFARFVIRRMEPGCKISTNG